MGRSTGGSTTSEREPAPHDRRLIGMRPSSTLRSVGVAIALVALAACGDDASTVTDASPFDRTFLSRTVTEDGGERPLVSGTEIRLTFEDDSISVHAGCNHLFGEVRSIDGGTLSVSGMGGTEMGCDPALHEQDRWLAELLEADPDWALDGSTLTISTASTTIVLVDRVEADPDRAFEGTRWVVDTLYSGDTASSLATDAEAVLVFTDGRLDGSTGCNTITGTYHLDDDRLRIDDVVRSDAACPGAAGELEAAIVDAVEVDLAVDVVAARLTLMTDDGHGLGLRADEAP